MTTIVGALAPIFLLILLGWGVRATAFVPDAFWAPAEKLTYFLLFPALLVANLAEARLDGLPVGAMAASQAGGILALALAVTLLRDAAGRGLGVDGPGYSSLFQGAIRPNTYVGLAAAAGLWGAQGVTLTAICVALVVPLVNVLSVIALARWAAPAGTPPGWRRTVLALAKNPLIAACLVGIALNAAGIGLPPIIGPFLKILASASLPLGLLAVGAGLDLKGLRGGSGAVAASLTAKHALLPAVAGMVALGLGVSGLPLAVCVLYAGLPVAPNSYVLARQLGGDARLMAAIVTVSTLVAAATLPVLAAATEQLILR